MEITRHFIPHPDPAVAARLARGLDSFCRRLAERDPDGRGAEWFKAYIMANCEWYAGRPILTEAMTANLPCPYDPEPDL